MITLIASRCHSPVRWPLTKCTCAYVVNDYKLLPLSWDGFGARDGLVGDVDRAVLSAESARSTAGLAGMTGLLVSGLGFVSS